ncbi:hypothetical protein MGQ_04284 [Candida albicans P76067]|nr:hypothetical protein MGO_04276 [Candida albicans P76055]KHC32945.1 hypothetical protein MGQ_04284 [Candida albicans P76067]
MVLLVRFPDLAMIVDLARDESKMCIGKKKKLFWKNYLTSLLNYHSQNKQCCTSLG